MDNIDLKLYNSCIKFETGTFSAKQLQQKMQRFGQNVSIKTLRLWLKEDINVFQLDKDVYITKAGCFTGREFGIKPTKYEIENNILIVGHRCVPFIDGEVLPFEIKFVNGKESLEYTCKNLLTSELIQHHSIFGEENFLQFVMFDPVNEGKDFSYNGFELPPYLDFTVLDMTSFYKKYDFQYEDWIHGRIISFAENKVSLEPDCRHIYNPFEQSVFDEKKEEWYKIFEKKIIENLKRFGPRSCIEEQLMMHFVNSMTELSVAYAGSVEEFLKKTDKVSFCEFGVESRLWMTGEDISESKNWAGTSVTEENPVADFLGLQLSEEIIDAFVLDSLFRKEEDYSKIIDRLFDEEYSNPIETEFLKILVQSRFTFLKKNYNWFADYEIASLRERALDVFVKTHCLYKKLESSQTQIDDYPQQDLITFMQLYSHIKRMVESIVVLDDIDQSSMNAAYSSLDGMEYTLEEIESSIKAVLKIGPWNKNL